MGSRLGGKTSEKRGVLTHLAEWLEKKVTIPSLGEDMEKVELLYIAGGNIK